MDKKAYKTNYQTNTQTQYQRPTKTFQETLTNQQIMDSLKDYKHISDISKVSIGTHLRYFTVNPKTKEKLFRLGGNLNKFGDNGQYLILSNGKTMWSVQIPTSIFYQKMNEKEIKEEIKKELKKEIETESNINTHLEENYDDLKKKFKHLMKKYETLADVEKDYKTLLKENEKLHNKLESIESEIISNKKKGKKGL